MDPQAIHELTGMVGVLVPIAGIALAGYVVLLAMRRSQAQTQAPPANDLARDMRQLFETLKPQQQALLWLAYVEGFDHREIASALQLREGSVKVLLFRARKRLARILSQHGLGPQEPL